MSKEGKNDFEKSERHRVRRYLAYGLATMFLTYVAFSVAFQIYPSESHLLQVANMTTQLAGILIGFEAIAVFYFLGAINSQRDRQIQMRSSLSVRLHYKDKNVTKELSESLGLADKGYEIISGFVVDTTVYSIAYFGGAVFLAMLSTVIVNDIPLKIGLAFLIAGITSIVVVMTEVQKMLNLLSRSQSTSALLVAQVLGIAQSKSR
jgi:hypothetical protein